jgi:hypothetical protein
VKTVKIPLSEAEYASLLAMKKVHGVPSIPALLKKLAGLYTESAEATAIVDTAMRKAKRKPLNEEFRLKDLFLPSRWESFGKIPRLRAGKLFRDRVTLAVDGIVATRKNSTNHQFYSRTSG